MPSVVQLAHISSVDFPLPDSPININISPFFTSKLALNIATVVFVSCSTSFLL
jgi:hypothetical protein